VARTTNGLGRTLAASRGQLTRARLYLVRTLWEVDEPSLPRARRILLTILRLVFVTVDSFFRERLQMRAAALAFFTVLSIVPLAALVFSVAKGVGYYDLLIDETVRPFLDQTFRPPLGGEVSSGVAVLSTNLEQLLDLVGTTDVFGLGLVGLVVLLLTIHRVVRGAEESFDAIWGFPGRRGLLGRLPTYLVVSVFTPLALVFASTLTAARQGQPAMALLASYVGVPFLASVIAFVLPPVLVWLAILPLYVLLPSARVRRRSAMMGAVVAGLAWYGLQVLHVAFQIGVARQNALYSGFGAFPIFLLWLHFSWVMILLGAQVAAAHQNAPTLRQLARRSLGDHVSRQQVALRALVALSLVSEGIRLRTLARELGVAVEPMREVLDVLTEHGYLTLGHGPYDPRYAVASDPDSLRVATVLDALGRGSATDSSAPWEEDPLHDVLSALQSAAESSAANRTIGELGRAHAEAASASDELGADG
jgi:membrane protein